MDFFSKENMRAIDFFCGGGGMTSGLTSAGIDVIAGIDCDINVKDTYEFNNPKSKFICESIEKLDLDIFEKQFGISKKEDNLIFVGCSPCQFYSIINTDRTKSRSTKDLLKYFSNFIGYYLPGFVLVENVPGIVTNKDTILPHFEEQLKKYGYSKIESGILQLCYYGVPQTRKRFSLIATRLNNVHITLPEKDKKPSILKDFIGPEHGFEPISAGHKDLSTFNHTTASLSDKCLKRLQKTQKNGGSRFDWADDPELQLKCFIGKDNSFRDTFGRMCWDKPAPTITTKFYSISNGRFAHPDEDRGISIREGATLQTFNSSYVFKGGNMGQNARMIGNAVPCEFAKRLGLAIRKSYDERK